jgi:competence protein ComFC
MAIVKIDPSPIVGNWHKGVALDLHTTSSVPIGYNEQGRMQFDSTRPPIAQLLYSLKNRGDKSAVQDIVDTAAHYLKDHVEKFDVIVPVPPSQIRIIQPVILIAEGVGKALSKPVALCVSTTRSTGQLKNVTDPEERKEKVKDLYKVDATQVIGRSVLLMDDLFRSGTTLNAVTDLLMGEGKAKIVRAFTITKTRSNR